MFRVGSQSITTMVVNLFVIFAVGALGSVTAQELPTTEDRYVISGGFYFHTESGEFKPNRGIHVEDGRIASIDQPPRADQTQISLTDDDYILPGLIDLHAHYNMTLVQRRREEFEGTPIIYLANGATVTFSCGEYLPEQMRELRLRIERGEQIGPKLITSGPYFGSARPGWRRQSPSPQQIRDEVDFWAEAGAGGFKAKGIDPESLRVLIDQAHRHGLTVTGHLDSGFRNSVNPKDAILMGIDRVEHFLGGDAMPSTQSAYASLPAITADMPEFKEITQLYIEHGVYFDATITAYGYFGHLEEEFDYWIDEREFFTPYVQELVAQRTRRPMQQFERIYQAKQKTIAEFWKAGGLITLGTDHNSVGAFLAGFGVHREMDVMVRSGIPPADVIRIATINGARAMKIDDDHGSIDEGKWADLYIVRGNPLDNIRNTRNGRYVVRAGSVYEPEKLFASVRGTIGPNNEQEASGW